MHDDDNELCKRGHVLIQCVMCFGEKHHVSYDEARKLPPCADCKGPMIAVAGRSDEHEKLVDLIMYTQDNTNFAFDYASNEPIENPKRVVH